MIVTSQVNRIEFVVLFQKMIFVDYTLILAVNKITTDVMNCKFEHCLILRLYHL